MKRMPDKSAEIPPAALTLEQISVSMGGRQILSELSLQVLSGEVLALLGPSGCGKTSVLKILLGLLRPDHGRVLIAGHVASEAGRNRLSPERRNLAVVFQDLALWPHLRVEDQLEFGLKARGIGALERRQRIDAMLKRVGLARRSRSYPGELSGGERQRVAIARALVLAPEALLMDEPLSSLDVGLKRELLAMFAELLAEHGTAALYVTHDPREAATLGDRLAVMEAGCLVQTGTLAELEAAPVNRFVADLLEDLYWTGRAKDKRNADLL